MRVGPITASDPRISPPARAGAPMRTKLRISGTASSRPITTRTASCRVSRYAPSSSATRSFSSRVFSSSRRRSRSCFGYEVGHALHKNVPGRLAAGQRAALIKLFQALHQPVVLAAFLVDAPRQLYPHTADRPAAEVFVDVVGGGVQIRLIQVLLQTHHAVVDHPGACHHHGQNFLVALAGKINVIESILGPGVSDGHAHAARNQ